MDMLQEASESFNTYIDMTSQENAVSSNTLTGCATSENNTVKKAQKKANNHQSC